MDEPVNEVGLDHLTKKFVSVMKREVDLNQELDGKAGWREVKQNVARKFRINYADIAKITSELKRKRIISTERRRRKRIGVNL